MGEGAKVQREAGAAPATHPTSQGPGAGPGPLLLGREQGLADRVQPRALLPLPCSVQRLVQGQKGPEL